MLAQFAELNTNMCLRHPQFCATFPLLPCRGHSSTVTTWDFVPKPSSNSSKQDLPTFPLYVSTDMKVVLLLPVFVLAVSAQFQFFDQFFGGQQQQQQEKQNVGSDSSWFQQNWHQGRLIILACGD